MGELEKRSSLFPTEIFEIDDVNHGLPSSKAPHRLYDGFSDTMVIQSDIVNQSG